MNTKAFPEHNWRFGNPKAFYITIGKKSLIYIQNYYQMFGQNEESIVKHIVLLK